jgi:hypothetical protein
MSGRNAKASEAFASKRKRQAVWNKACKVAGLSSHESNQAASIIRPGASIKVLSWPSL